MLGIRQHRGVQIDLHQGDLGLFVSDAFVIPVSAVRGGCGAAAAAALALAGPAVAQTVQSKALRSPGPVVVTDVGALPAKYLICSVSPDWTGASDEDVQGLQEAYRASLRAFAQLGDRHVSLIPLSAGAPGSPSGIAADLALGMVREFLDSDDLRGLRRVTFVLADSEEYQTYRQAMFKVFPEVDQE